MIQCVYNNIINDLLFIYIWFIIYLDFSDEVRQGFGTLPDCVPKENEGAAEDTLERYKRLKQEVADLLADMERLKTVCTVGPLLKGTLNKGHNTFNLSIKDMFCGPYRTTSMQFYLLKRTTSV